LPRPRINSPLPTPIIVSCRKHLVTYYSRYLRVYGLEEEDVIQSVLLKLLDGSCSNINSACSTVIRAGVRYRQREILR
jgi:hypothetical protein